MFTILSKRSGCVYCDRAKSLLTERGIEYVEIPFDSLDEVRTRYAPAVDPDTIKTFPLIFKNGRCIGGFEHLRDHLEEPILKEDTNRLSAFPIEHADVYDLYKKAVSCFWTSDEISLRDDIDAFEALSKNERHFLTHVLAFFAQSDAIVLQNLMSNFCNEVQLLESKMFYSLQAFMESEHSIVYSMLIDALVRDHREKHRLFDAITHVPAVRKKALWAQRWLDRSNRFATRLVAFACVEGILFSGSFCAIFWLKQRTNMPGLSLSNQFISRDERLHVDHATALYRKLEHKLTHRELSEIVREAVENEKEFICEALPCKLIGMNAQSMGMYIQFVADCLCIDLGHEPIYEAENPYTWMTSLGLEGKTNFFESRASDYQRATVNDGDGSGGDEDDF